MGCSQSTATSTPTNSKDAAAGSKLETAPAEVVQGEWEEYELKKHRPGCNGMFWRSDPTLKTILLSNNHWPKDGAKLRGTIVTVDGEKWLLAKQVKQKGSEKWHTAPGGAAMPFEYDGHYYLG
jgi:hypothetical protein